MEEFVAGVAAARSALFQAFDDVAAIERRVADVERFAAANELAIGPGGTVTDARPPSLLPMPLLGQPSPEAVAAERQRLVDECVSQMDQVLRAAGELDADLSGLLAAVVAGKVEAPLNGVWAAEREAAAHKLSVVDDKLASSNTVDQILTQGNWKCWPWTSRMSGPRPGPGRHRRRQRRHGQTRRRTGRADLLLSASKA